MQEIFTMLADYLIITNCLEKYLSLKAQRLYRELLKISIQKSREKFEFNYPDLEEKLKYTHESLRQAFVELEKVGLVLRGVMNGTCVKYVEMDTRFFEEHLGIL
jgi:hypothetical protein